MYSRFYLHLSGWLFLFLLMGGCRQSIKTSEGKTDYIITEKDLIPEGLAFDPLHASIFVSSTYKRKIIRIDSTGRISDFVSSGKNGIWSVIGMEADPFRRHLWVISSQAAEVLPLINPDSMQWRSAIYQYDLDKGILLRSWLLAAENVFLNDLTIAPNGDCFATESMQNKIYRLPAGGHSIELLLAPQPYTFLNGIDFSDQPNQLFVSATEGIIKIDLASLSYSLLKAGQGIDPSEIDGLSFYKNSIIGHQSNRLSSFLLNAAQDSILTATILDQGAEFDGSTTGETNMNAYYFIVNSQIQSGIDFKQRMLKPVDSLKNVIIRKLMLP